jgi:hypothetical protein
MTDQPKFDNSALLAAMLAVAHHDTPENRRILYESMLNTCFLVPTRDAAPPGMPGFHGMKEDPSQSFSLEHDPAGMVVLPAFTDEEALRNWNKTILWIALQGAAFFQAVVATETENIVINPYEIEDPASKMIRPGGRVTRWEFELLAQGRLPQPDLEGEDTEAEEAQAGREDSQPVLLSTPLVMPSKELFDALIAAAKNMPVVQAMYFSQVTNAHGESRRSVAVEFASGTSDEMVARTCKALRKRAHQASASKSLDFLATSTDLGRAITTTGQKFY